MSVFQLQDWWSVKVTQDGTEEFDLSCFCVGNADNAYPTSNKILVGSQAGILRMYHPTKPNFRIEDLVLEEMLGSPILQVSLGRFIPGSELLGVAILHPRELVVYEILPQAVKDDRVSYYTLRRVYSHELGVEGKHFTAFNMTFGAFGGVRGRDMILVQSMDGKLQIFEQSAHAFTRQLADCLLPGPLVYVPKIDAFVTVHYSGQAECYRYQVLASSQSETVERRSEHKSGGDSKQGESSATNAFGIRAVRNTVCEWTVNLGENARQIVLGHFVINEHGLVVNNSGPANELLFLCEKSLFLVKAETGGIIQQRRIERADPSCVCLIPYVAELPNGQTITAHNFLLADQEGTVQVYQGLNLVWAVRVPSAPVYMTVSSFGGQRGLVVSIDETGYLSIGYLGTKPPVQAFLSQVRDLDYDKIDEEHRALLQVIRESQSEHKHESHDRLLMKCQIPKSFDLEPVQIANIPNIAELRSQLVQFPANTTQSTAGNEPIVKLTVRLYVTYTGAQSASQVSLVISTPPNIHAHPKSVQLDRITGARSTPTVVKVHFLALKSAVLTHSDITVTASYQSPKGEPGIITYSFELPLFVSVRPKPPTKSAPVKLILDTEYPAIPLTELFSDVLFAYQETGMDVSDVLGSNAAQALGFQTQAPVLNIEMDAVEALQQGLKTAGVLDRLSVLQQSTTYGSNVTSSSGLNGDADLLPGQQFDVNSSEHPQTVQVRLPEVASNIAPSVSILVSKNAGRYRIQSESYPALAGLCAELEKRLQLRLHEAPNANLSIMSPTSTTKSESTHSHAHGHTLPYVFCSEALPTEEFFGYIAQHLSLRHALLYKTRVLQDRTTQYRMIEKRLLVRFKDKNPTPLHGLEVMLQDTYQQILILADEIESIQRTITQLRHEIDAFARLLAQLISLKCRLSYVDRQALTAYLCPVLRDGMEQGWEETVTASLAHLLKTALSKSGHKESSSAVQMNSATLEIPKTIDALRKNFLLVIDRLEKGGKIVTTTAASLQNQPQAQTDATSNGSNTATNNQTSNVKNNSGDSSRNDRK